MSSIATINTEAHRYLSLYLTTQPPVRALFHGVFAATLTGSVASRIPYQLAPRGACFYSLRYREGSSWKLRYVMVRLLLYSWLPEDGEIMAKGRSTKWRSKSGHKNTARGSSDSLSRESTPRRATTLQLTATPLASPLPLLILQTSRSDTGIFEI